MVRFYFHLTVAILVFSTSSSWAEENEMSKYLLQKRFPKKFITMDLDSIRKSLTTTATTTDVIDVTDAPTEVITEVITDNLESQDIPEQLEEKKIEQLTLSEEQEFDSKVRRKKYSSAKFCVEIRPKNPYQRPFEVCQPQPPIEPYYPPKKPIIFIPHVPVAEPYHVPSPHHQVPPIEQHHPEHPASAGEVYRTSGVMNLDDISPIFISRSAYGSYGPYDDYDKTSVYDFHKKKEISYIPVMTKTISKTKPLKYLKVLSDLKKDKVKIVGYDDDYYQPQPQYQPHQQYHHSYGGYGHQDLSYGNNYKKNNHGLVITCQPSAVGYSGPIIDNHYQDYETTHHKMEHAPVPTSGGYIPPTTYRKSEKSAEMSPTSELKLMQEEPVLKIPSDWQEMQISPDEMKILQMANENAGMSLAPAPNPQPTLEAMNIEKRRAFNAFRNAQNQFSMKQKRA